MTGPRFLPVVRLNGGLPVALAYTLALIFGSLTGLAYAPFSCWPLALVGVGAFLLLIGEVSGRRAVGLGYMFGLVMMGFNSAGIEALSWWFAGLLVGFMACWTALLAGVVRQVMRLPAWPVWVACWWSAMELAYSRVPFGGFGWARLVFTTPDQPLSGFLPVFGAGGVSWLVAFCAALLAWTVRQQRVRQVMAGLLFLTVIFAVGALLQARPASLEDGEQVKVGVVQGNVDGNSRWESLGEPRSVTKNHVFETAVLMDQVRSGLLDKPDFILWPENSTDLDPQSDEQTKAGVVAASQLSGLPILLGTVTTGPGVGERQTTSMWWAPEVGETARYSKRNLVPFGEYMPARSLVDKFVSTADLIGRQSVPGVGPGVLLADVPNHGKLNIATIICYELAFDSTVYDTVKAGGDLITVQSSNATFAGTWQPRQQFAITRVRAMELRREIVVSTTSSISGLIDARGKVIDRTQESTAAARSYSVPIRHDVTLGAMVSIWWQWLAMAVALGSLIFVLVSKIPSRRS